MEHKEFDRLVTQAFEQLQNNRLFFPGEGVELPVLQRPLWGVASAEDPIFEEFKKPQVIGANFKAPKEWMPQAM
ncbi:MAG: hypothetical protein HUJ80_03400, partial [Firmicutes bacterium]|nr:hypothetical protein [Bacillota bacterium]